MGTLFVDKLDPQSGTSLEIGSSGDTISVPSGATINLSNATQTGVGIAGSPIMIMKGNGSDQSIATGTFTKMTNLTAEENSDGLYDTSTNTVTIPSGKGGKYLINIQTNMTTSTDFDQFAIRIRKNGSDFLYSSVRNEYQESNGLSAIKDLAASDELEVNIYHTRSGSNSGINGSPYRTLYSIVRLAE